MPLRSDVSLADVVRATHELGDAGDPLTNLGICPMSEELIEIPVELARSYNFPLIFVVSRNQVSENPGGGYVMGLTPERFVAKIEEVEARQGLGTYCGDYLRFVAVDHCGPWYREDEKSLPRSEAAESVKATLRACLQAGYAALHIDCSFAPPPSLTMTETDIIDMTVELIAFAEEERKKLSLGPVSYEVGTEETAGASVSVAHFRDSLQTLSQKLDARGLPRPAFVVGRTGAEVKLLENVGGFDYTAASELPRVARALGVGFKEHNGDHLSDQILQLHPRYGITGVNVGPAFAAAQNAAWVHLAFREERALGDKGSRFYQRLSQAVLQHAPFHKWLRSGDSWTAEQLAEMPAELLAVTTTCGHYVYDQEEIVTARRTLCDNLVNHGLMPDPHGYVREAVRKALVRYIVPLNLSGSTNKIIRHLSASKSA